MPIGDPIIPTAHIVANHLKLVTKSNAVRFIKPRFFKVDQNKIFMEQGGEPSIGDFSVTASGYDKMSWLNTPIYDVFRVLPFSYTDQDGKVVKILEAPKEGEIGGGSIDFDTVLMEVNQAKNIVATKVAGRNGSVKEYISDGDYEITVTGMITSKYNNVSPFEADPNYMAAIMDILKANVAFPVSSNFLTIFGIKSVVVMDYKMNQIEGTRNAIGLTISLLSDVPFEIEVKYQEDSVRNARKNIFTF